MNKGEANEREKWELRKENKLALLIKKTYENTLANSTIFRRNIGLCYFTSNIIAAAGYNFIANHLSYEQDYDEQDQFIISTDKITHLKIRI